MVVNKEPRLSVSDVNRRVASKIRKFKLEDIDEILQIEEEAFPKTAYPKEAFIDYANSFPNSFIVVESGKDIAGYVVFDMEGHILSTAVRQQFRRKGFGKKLFMYALKCAKRRLRLEVRATNEGAIEFYKKLGMKIVKKMSDYYGDDDALLMVLGEKEWVSRIESRQYD
jgi:ribosomal-protein-alanine N-acetyltransferase